MQLPSEINDALQMIECKASDSSKQVPEDIYEFATIICAAAAMTKDEGKRARLLVIAVGKAWQAGHAAGEEYQNQPGD